MSARSIAGTATNQRRSATIVPQSISRICSRCCGAARRCGHLHRLPHFLGSIVCLRDFLPFGTGASRADLSGDNAAGSGICKVEGVKHFEMRWPALTRPEFAASSPRRSFVIPALRSSRSIFAVRVAGVRTKRTFANICLRSALRDTELADGIPEVVNGPRKFRFPIRQNMVGSLD